jgi:hypothetical protein
MADRFTSFEAAEEFVSELQGHGLRALVWESDPLSGVWQVSAPDLDFRRDDRIWESGHVAAQHRLAEVVTQ